MKLNAIIADVASRTAKRVQQAIANAPAPVAPKRSPPTDEAMRHLQVRDGKGVLRGGYKSAGMAYRSVPMIDTLRDIGKLSDDHHRRLTHYRDQNAVAESSLTKSCLDVRIAGGRGDMPLSASVLSAQLEAGRIERDLGSLRGIARSIAIDDWSLSRWCCERYGSRERYDGKGRFVAMVPLREKENMAMALMELRMAAGKIVA